MPNAPDRLRGPSLRFLLLLVALVAVLYGPTLNDGWHFDDLGELDISGARELRPDAARAHYRGIVTLWTWVANYKLSGEDPWSYHTLNVLVHLLVSLCVYVVGAELLTQLPRFWARAAATHGSDVAEAPRSEPAATRRFAVIASLVYGAHPLATQSVSYVAQRSTALGALFTLSALALYLTARRTQSTWRRGAWLAGALVTYQIALHAKHVAVCLPALLLAFEWLASPDATRSLRQRLLLVVPFALLAAVRIVDFAPRHLTGGADALNETTPTRIDYLLTETRALLAYAKLAVLPIGQNLDHDFPLSHSLLEPSVLISLGILLVVGLATVRLARRAPVVAFGSILFVVALLPTSSFVPSPDVFFEHRAYLSLAGFSLAVTWGILRVERQWPRTTTFLPGAIIILLSILTIARNQQWSSEVALWSDAAAKSPNKVRPQLNLGLALQDSGRLREAESLYERVLRIDPENVLAKNNLGNIALARGEYERAMRLLEEAITTRPAYFEAHLNLGNVHLALGHYEEAEAQYRNALEIDAGSTPAEYNLAKCYEKSRRWDAAARTFENLVAREPHNARFLNDLGCAYLAVGRLMDAEQKLRTAISTQPGWAVPYHNLGLVLDAQGRYEESIAAKEKAAALGLPAPTSGP